MTKFLAFQHTHGGVQAAVFQGRKIIQKIFEDKKRSSKYFIAMIDSLLKKTSIKMSDISFIAANQGPGPFTTLRVVMASVNGLAFSCNKPLIGVDGLDALLQEHRDTKYPVTVALLDAYSKDVYFGIAHDQNKRYQKGYKNIDLFLSDLRNRYPNTAVQLIGNGVQKYQQQIVSVLGDSAIISDSLVYNCSIDQLGLMAYEKWQKQTDVLDQLLPTYLKSMVIKKAGPSSF